jgi:hypothetical protein
LEPRRTHPEINPQKQEWKYGPERGIYKQAKAPEEAVQNKIPPTGIVGQAKSGPEKSDR